MRWADYRLLQAYDRLSLLFCMRDLEREPTFEVGPVPAIEPRGAVADRSIEPYPLAERPVHAQARPPPVPKQEWTQDAFRERFLELPPERVEIVVEP